MISDLQVHQQEGHVNVLAEAVLQLHVAIATAKANQLRLPIYTTKNVWHY